jgi:hypothetical protein
VSHTKPTYPLLAVWADRREPPPTLFTPLVKCILSRVLVRKSSRSKSVGIGCGPVSGMSSGVTPADGKKFQLSTFCRKESGSKIFTFSYGLTTLVREKFIGSCSLRSRQMAAKSYHSVDRNMDYKVIPSSLMSRPSRGRHTSLPPTLPRPSSVQK